MENSRKPRSGSLAGRVETALRGIVRPDDHLIVALSGGVDSVVLLNLLVPLSAQMKFSLSAVHVNHGISVNASGWSRFCDHLCQSQGVPLHTVCVKIRREPAISLEAAARAARYGIFGRLRADYVVLAQHLDDQAETLMLQLLRGAGVKGLSGMPVVRTLLRKDTSLTLQVRESGSERPPRLLRPLLEASRREIEEHAREQGLQWITDESNEDTSFDRNFLRHEVFPRVEKRFPSYRSALLRASRNLAEASALLDELAQADSSSGMVAGKLHVEDLRKLSFPRAKNLLRYMLAQQGATLPSAIKLGEILRQLLSAGPDANLRVIFGAAEIRCFKGLVYLRNISGQTGESAGTGWQVRWKGEEQLAIPELGGTLAFRQGKGERMRGRGISLEKMCAQPVSIRPRLGGERLRPDCKRPRRSLKNLLREASLPPWQRGLPLMFSGEQLVYVPGIGVDCDFQADGTERALAVEWIVLPG